MKNPYFFGYGSLVNQATHDYPNAAKATAFGWRRAWVDTPVRPFAYLTAVRAEGAQIDGLIAEVPGADWGALDEREDAYDRILDSDNVKHTHPYASEIAIYSVPNENMQSQQDRLPILLSYLDVVLQGYMREYGQSGARGFIDSTDGWTAPVLNDRADPIYPRHQLLSETERDFVDQALLELGIKVLNQ